MAYMRMNIQNALSYRGPILIWLMSNVVTLVIFVSLWLSVETTGGKIADYSKNELVTYYVGGLLLQWIVGWYPTWIRDEIKSGEIVGNTLSKPVILYWKVFFMDFGWHLVSVWVGLLAVLIMGYILFPYIVFSPTLVQIILTVAAIIIAIFVTFTTCMCIGLLSFWLTQADAFDGLFWAGRSLIGGEGIPIAILPAGLLFTIKLLPFRYMYSFPLEIILGKLSEYEIVYGFAAGIIWTLILIVIYQVMWSKGTKTYTSAGV